MIAAYHKCRRDNGGADGRCKKKVKGYKCKEGEREGVPGVQYSAKVDLQERLEEDRLRVQDEPLRCIAPRALALGQVEVLAELLHHRVGGDRGARLVQVQAVGLADDRLLAVDVDRVAVDPARGEDRARGR